MIDAELLTEITPVFFATKTDMDEYRAALILLNYFRSFESKDTVMEVLERILVRDAIDTTDAANTGTGKTDAGTDTINTAIDKTGIVYTLDPAFINKTELKTVLETAVNDSISIVEEMMLSGSLDIDGVPFKDSDIWDEDIVELRKLDLNAVIENVSPEFAGWLYEVYEKMNAA